MDKVIQEITKTQLCALKAIFINMNGMARCIILYLLKVNLSMTELFLITPSNVSG